MTRLALAASLLADGSSWTHMGSHFRRGSENFTSRDLLILLVVVAVAAGVTWVLSRTLYGKERRIQNNPRTLFRELCRAHGLNAAGRRLLTELAGSRGLANPALLFLEPAHFELVQLKAEIQPRAGEIQVLAERLFGP